MSAATKTEKPKTEAKVKVVPVHKRPLNAEQAAQVALVARPAVSPCLCGCKETTKGRFFPGHDAILKERLKATVDGKDADAAASATAALATFGW